MLRLTRDQVVAFRTAALHLDQRLPVDQLVEGVRPCGLQDTPPGNAVAGWRLAARVQGLTLEGWAAVERKKSLVELWAMRGSPIVVATADLPYFTAGLLADDEASLLHAITSDMDVVVVAAGISAADLLDRLSERAAELLGWPQPQQGRGWRGTGAGAARASSRSAGRRRRGARYGSAGGPDPDRRPPHLAQGSLRDGAARGWQGADLGADRPVAGPRARRHLAHRSPGRARPALSPRLRSRHVRRTWCGGRTQQTSPAARKANEAHAARIWSLLDREVTEVERPDGSRGFVLTSDFSRLANPPTAVGIRLIPPYDPLLLARDRETLVAREHHRRLWRSTHNPGVVLSGGEVVATWTARKHGRLLAITLDSLGGPLDRRTHDAVGAEAALLAPLRGCSGARVEVAD